VGAPRNVVGYHGCSTESAEKIIAEQQFMSSQRAYDWLGEGVYFWEYAPYRALDWAILKCDREGGRPAVLKATIKLGRCLNLLDIEHIPGVREAYRSFAHKLDPARIPRNTDSGAHFLDRLILDAYCRRVDMRSGSLVQTVLGSFAEGEAIYPGSKILEKAHTQIAVRDVACIIRPALVTFY
jgi:hypothetical protein